jgi:hypothetical protein
MTMIAAFPLRGIPVLIGDFLLTDNQTNSKHLFFPTRPGHQNKKPSEKSGRVAGMRKKIHKISERLVVGFTGDLRPGEKLMKALIKQFGDKRLTKDELEKFLSEIVITDKHKTKLVGWIWENRPLCFEWKGSAPNKVEIVASTFSGSGGEHFRNEIMKVDSFGFEGVKTELEKAIYIAVAQVGKIFCSELMGASNLDYAYGGGAEIILWDGSKFLYVDNIVYAFWNALINEDNSLIFSFGNVSAVYKNFDKFSILQVNVIGPHIGPHSAIIGVESINTYSNLITPINDTMPNYKAHKIGQLSFDAPIWFTGIVVNNFKKSKQVILKFVSDGSEVNNSITYYKDGMMCIRSNQVKAILPQEIFN